MIVSAPDAILIGAAVLSAPWWFKEWRIHREDFNDRLEAIKAAFDHGAEVLGQKRPTARVDEDRDATTPFGGR